MADINIFGKFISKTQDGKLVNFNAIDEVPPRVIEVLNSGITPENVEALSALLELVSGMTPMTMQATLEDNSTKTYLILGKEITAE